MIRLQNGNRVCIIGGGPAGSFAALHLLCLAAEHGLHLEVLIFEPRDFNMPGPAGCNRCAGVLSSRLLRGMESLNLHLPAEVIQADLHTYALTLDGDILRVQQPNPARRIVSIYRGGGPKHGDERPPPVSFDGWLLRQAQTHGAQHIQRRVLRVSREDARPTIHTKDGHYTADFLVLASGVNSRPPLDAAFGYRPPVTETMLQDEILMPAGWQKGEVRAYFRAPHWLTFGALIPKNRFLNISLLGKRIPPDGVTDFLDTIHLPRSLEPQGVTRLCGCAPKIVTGMARPVCGERWVAVGDAAVSRLYKDGIGSAFYTARAAMHTAIVHGISKRSLQSGYTPYCRRIYWDNLCGRALFTLWHFTLQTPILLYAWQRTLRYEARLPARKRIHERILWGMFTGDEPYTRLLFLACSPVSLWRIIREMRLE
ncbi:MAG: hypothetical protein Fur0018_12210 [Anaerolineales bacterium]